MITKPINPEAVNIFVDSLFWKNFNFAISSRALEVRHDHYFKDAGFVLSRYKSASLRMKFPTQRVKNPSGKERLNE